MQDIRGFVSLVERFGSYVDLNGEEEELLRDLERSEISFKPRTQLHLQNLSSDLYTLKSGWLYRYVDLPNGNRQILRIYLPGEIVGMDDVALVENLNNTMSASDVVISPFSKKNIENIFRISPRLSTLLFSMSMLEKAILTDRIKMIGKSSALTGVASLMLEFQTRLKLISDECNFDTFEVPLTQENIADALGLTNVTVSNAFSQLEQDGKISYKRGSVTIHNSDELKKELDFNEHQYQIDTSWLPSD